MLKHIIKNEKKWIDTSTIPVSIPFLQLSPIDKNNKVALNQKLLHTMKSIGIFGCTKGMKGNVLMARAPKRYSRSSIICPLKMKLIIPISLS